MIKLLPTWAIIQVPDLVVSCIFGLTYIILFSQPFMNTIGLIGFLP